MLFLLLLVNQLESAEIQRPKEHLPDLADAQSVLIEVHVSPSHGFVDLERVSEIVIHRMEELGYAVVEDRLRPHDVAVQITCGEPEVPENGQTATNILNSTFAGMAPRKGPPCLFTYRFQGKPIPWQRIDRIIYSEGVQTAKRLFSHHPTTSSSATIFTYLERFEFAILLSAEWGQTQRLVRIFHDPGTDVTRKNMIIALLGETQAHQAFPLLVDTLTDKTLVTGAARALGHFGKRARPYLTSLLQTSARPETQAAAANGLGRIGAMTGDTSSTMILLQALTAHGVDRRVQTEVVWALGKAPDFRAFPVLEELEREIWLLRSQDPEIQELRQAVDWSIREVRQGGHTDDY